MRSSAIVCSTTPPDFIAGCLIAILFFRRISFMMIAAGPPLIAILLALGALGWLDFRLNMFLNVMTPLIMVISFSDFMQLTFATRDRLLHGQSKFEALKGAILVVGPACVLTARHRRAYRSQLSSCPIPT